MMLARSVEEFPEEIKIQTVRRTPRETKIPHLLSSVTWRVRLHHHLQILLLLLHYHHLLLLLHLHARARPARAFGGRVRGLVDGVARGRNGDVEPRRRDGRRGRAGRARSTSSCSWARPRSRTSCRKQHARLRGRRRTRVPCASTYYYLGSENACHHWLRALYSKVGISNPSCCTFSLASAPISSSSKSSSSACSAKSMPCAASSPPRADETGGSSTPRYARFWTQ